MVKLTTQNICEGELWGPWHDGMLTECFLQLTIISAVGLFFLIGGTIRLFQLRNSDFNYNFGKIQKMKVVFCVLLSLMELGSLAAGTILHYYNYFQIMADIRDTLCWGLCAIVISLEFASGSLHWWVVRLWWVLEFIVTCLLMQSLVSRDKPYGMYGYDVTVTTVRFGLITILTIFGLWVNEKSTKSNYSNLSETESINSSVTFNSSSTTTTSSYGSFSHFRVENTKSPYVAANIFSRMFFIWPSSLVSMGYKKALNFSDLWDLPEEDTADYCTTKLEQNWIHEKTKKKPSLAKAIWVSHRKMFLLGCFGKLVQGTLFGPFVLNELIRFIGDPTAPSYYGFIWTFAMLGAFIVQTIGGNFSLFTVTRIGNQVRASVTSLVYRKSIKMSSSARSKFSTGEILNFQSIDSNRLAVVIPLLPLLWSAPLQMIVALIMLWYCLGPSMFAGLATMIFAIPINGYILKKSLVYQKQLMNRRDKSVRYKNELVHGIRLIKFFNWEENFLKNINESRGEELIQLEKSIKTRVMSLIILSCTPLCVSVVSFTTFSLSGHILTAQIAFTSLALFNTLRVPLGLLPNVLNSMVESNLALKRVQKYLESEEIRHETINAAVPPGTVIQVTNGAFKWGREAQKEVLKNINLNIKEGELIAIVGSVGSGKSSLLHAILGEIHKTSGHISVFGNIAYSPQQPWIQNTTLRNNILFGKPYVESKYKYCIQCCELTPDI